MEGEVRIQLAATLASAPGIGIAGRVLSNDVPGLEAGSRVMGLGSGSLEVQQTLPRARLVRCAPQLSLYEPDGDPNPLLGHRRHGPERHPARERK